MINIYFNHNGNAREVIEFYQTVFDAPKAQIMTFEEAPNIDDRMKDWIMHGTLDIKGQTLMFSDTMPDDPASVGENITLLISLDDEKELRTRFLRLSDQAKIIQDLSPSFFSPLYGSLIDKFGTTWQFYLETSSDS